MNEQRYPEAETHLRKAVQLEPGIGEGQLPARPAAGAHGEEGGGGPPARAWRNRSARRTRRPRACSFGCWIPTMRRGPHPRGGRSCWPLSFAGRLARRPGAQAPSSARATAPRARGGRRARSRQTEASTWPWAWPIWERNDYPQALEVFQKAVKVGPRSAEAHNWLGVALAAKSDLPGAIAAFRKAIALDPKYGRAYSNLGSALAKSGDYDEAVEVFQKALALEPNSLAAHLNLGMALREKGDLEAALVHLRRVADGDPGNATRSVRARPDPAPERRSPGRRRRLREGDRDQSRAARGLLRAGHGARSSRARPPESRRPPRQPGRPIVQARPGGRRRAAT